MRRHAFPGPGEPGWGRRCAENGRKFSDASEWSKTHVPFLAQVHDADDPGAGMSVVAQPLDFVFDPAAALLGAPAEQSFHDKFVFGELAPFGWRVVGPQVRGIQLVKDVAVL